MTDDLHDVYSLGKEAAAMHCSLLDHISKVSLNHFLIFPDMICFSD